MPVRITVMLWSKQVSDKLSRRWILATGSALFIFIEAIGHAKTPAPASHLLPPTPGSMYTPSLSRYDSMPYHKCGKWGLKLPAISLASGITLVTMMT